MNEKQALSAFAALSQETRLRIVRLLVTAGPEGMPAGAIGEAMDGASSSRMSFHLSHLEQADLIESRRDGRSIIYSAAYPVLSDLIARTALGSIELPVGIVTAVRPTTALSPAAGLTIVSPSVSALMPEMPGSPSSATASAIAYS